MRPSLFAGIMLGATIALAHNAQAASTDTCVSMAELAKTIVSVRQAGIPQSLAEAMINKHGFRESERQTWIGFTRKTYQQPIVTSDSLRQQVEQVTYMTVLTECLK